MSEMSPQHRARERLKESLSVSLDGQAGEFELRRVIDGIGSDDNLRALACRYQLIGEVLRGESNKFTSRFADVDISKRVISAIEQEEVGNTFSHNVNVPGKEHSSTMGSRLGRFVGDVWAPLGKVAIAASVAVVAVVIVVGVKNNGNPTADLQLLAEADSAAMTQSVQLAQTSHSDYGASGIRAGYDSKQYGSGTPEQLAYAQSLAGSDRSIKERFHAYALQHAELSAMAGAQSILSFARLSSFDN